MSSPYLYQGSMHSMHLGQFRFKRLVDLVPDHEHYAEPYFVDGLLLFAKPIECESEVVNDCYRQLRRLREALDGPGTELFVAEISKDISAAMRRSQLHVRASSRHAAPLREAAALVVQAYANRFGAFWTSNQIDFELYERWGSAFEERKIGKFVIALRDVLEDFRCIAAVDQEPLQFIAENDGEGTLFYVQPPRMKGTGPVRKVRTPCSSRKEHVALVRTLIECRAKVMITGYPSLLYDQVAFSEWNCQELEPKKKAKGHRENPNLRVWCNF